jgi:hypothetical protein
VQSIWRQLPCSTLQRCRRTDRAKERTKIAYRLSASRRAWPADRSSGSSRLDARALRPSVQLNSINGKSSIGVVNPSPRQQPGGPNCRPFQAMPRFEGEKAINRDGSLSFNRNIQTKQTYVRAHLINLDTNRGRSNGC